MISFPPAPVGIGEINDFIDEIFTRRHQSLHFGDSILDEKEEVRVKSNPWGKSGYSPPTFVLAGKTSAIYLNRKNITLKSRPMPLEI